MRTTVVVTRWDLVEQDDLLLMKAVQSDSRVVAGQLMP
jgi:hypothetical protein